MKNVYKHIITGLIILTLFTSSCTNEDEIASSVTVYPEIEVSGDPTILVHQGQTYTESGVRASIGGNEVPLSTRFVGRYRRNVFNTTLNTTISDIYTAEYTAVNEEGFSRTATRQVVVANTGDLVNSIEGVYTSTVFRNGTQGSPPSNYTNIRYILIWRNDDGTYGISDAFGGWYLFGRNIPGSETPGGVIVANNIATNDFSFPGTLTNSYFGGTANITSMTVDPVNRTIVMTTNWTTGSTNYIFEARLNQVQF
ncbi:MAG TPA: immunoglobulin-like domain-containing protein [Flavobacterium sp.]|jgi:hypothetical protein